MEKDMDLDGKERVKLRVALRMDTFAKPLNIIPK
jgi:hypothetical protein